MSFFRDFFRPKSETEKESKDSRFEAERDLFEGMVGAAMNSVKKIVPFVPEEDKSTLIPKVYFEYIYFFLHLSNRLASSSGFSYGQVAKMQENIAPIVIDYVVRDVCANSTEEARAKLRDILYEGANAREIEYAKSKEYASKQWKPMTGTSTVEMLTRNIREILDTYNPEVLFQIQLVARKSAIAANLPKLIVNYGKTHP